MGNGFGCFFLVPVWTTSPTIPSNIGHPFLLVLCCLASVVYRAREIGKATFICPPYRCYLPFFFGGGGGGGVMMTCQTFLWIEVVMASPGLLW